MSLLIINLSSYASGVKNTCSCGKHHKNTLFEHAGLFLGADGVWFSTASTGGVPQEDSGVTAV